MNARARNNNNSKQYRARPPQVQTSGRTWPGLSAPLARAHSTQPSASRSFTLPIGLNASHLTYTLTPRGASRGESFTSGVAPIVESTLSWSSAGDGLRVSESFFGGVARPPPSPSAFGGGARPPPSPSARSAAAPVAAPIHVRAVRTARREGVIGSTEESTHV